MQQLLSCIRSMNAGKPDRSFRGDPDIVAVRSEKALSNYDSIFPRPSCQEGGKIEDSQRQEDHHVKGSQEYRKVDQSWSLLTQDLL